MEQNNQMDQIKEYCILTSTNPKLQGKQIPKLQGKQITFTYETKIYTYETNTFTDEIKHIVGVIRDCEKSSLYPDGDASFNELSIRILSIDGIKMSKLIPESKEKYGRELFTNPRGSYLLRDIKEPNIEDLDLSVGQTEEDFFNELKNNNKWVSFGYNNNITSRSNKIHNVTTEIGYVDRLGFFSKRDSSYYSYDGIQYKNGYKFEISDNAVESRAGVATDVGAGANVSTDVGAGANDVSTNVGTNLGANVNVGANANVGANDGANVGANVGATLGGKRKSHKLMKKHKSRKNKSKKNKNKRKPRK
jgi:hypothetical protein